jgi:hypothetical protein
MRPFKKNRLLVVAVAISLVVGVLLAAIVARTQQRGPEGSAPAQPAVAVFIKRGNHVARWDGRSPVQPGDLLSVELVAERFRRVRVISRSKSGTGTPYQGDVPADRSWLLPVTFEVDDRDLTHILDIVLSEGPTPGQTWSTVLLLPKVSSAQGRR